MELFKAYRKALAGAGSAAEFAEFIGNLLNLLA